jgi:hypothetical protein
MEQAHVTNGDYVRVVDWKVDRRHKMLSLLENLFSYPLGRLIEMQHMSFTY